MSELANLDGKKKAEYVKQIHEKARRNIERRTEQYAKQANKGRKEVLFQPGDLVWVHMRKERFPQQRRSKLMPRGEGPFRVLERINNNAYKIELPGEYSISSTFNVADLSRFDADDTQDLKTNPFEEGGNDEDIKTDEDSKGRAKELDLEVTGPMTRARAKRLQNAFTKLVDENILKRTLGSELGKGRDENKAGGELNEDEQDSEPVDPITRSRAKKLQVLYAEHILDVFGSRHEENHDGPDQSHYQALVHLISAQIEP